MFKPALLTTLLRAVFRGTAAVTGHVWGHWRESAAAEARAPRPETRRAANPIHDLIH